MKSIFALFFLLTNMLFSQNINYNTKKGYVAEGYDVVAYFENKVLEGKKEFSTEYDGVDFKFSSKENLATFKTNPIKYIPQYGGYCAYAIANKGKKVGIDPETFLIYNGKLYLFYNGWGTNTLKLWNKENTIELREKADKNWTVVMNNE